MASRPPTPSSHKPLNGGRGARGDHLLIWVALRGDHPIVHQCSSAVCLRVDFGIERTERFSLWNDSTVTATGRQLQAHSDHPCACVIKRVSRDSRRFSVFADGPQFLIAQDQSVQLGVARLRDLNVAANSSRARGVRLSIFGQRSWSSGINTLA